MFDSNFNNILIITIMKILRTDKYLNSYYNGLLLIRIAIVLQLYERMINESKKCGF
jgi:hypothetical protein